MYKRYRKLLAILLSTVLLVTGNSIVVFAEEGAFGTGTDYRTEEAAAEDAAPEEALESSQTADGALEEEAASEKQNEGDKDRLTVLVYGLGSDLERNNLDLSNDFTEMIAGMGTAVAKSGQTGSRVPINIIAETGGVTYEKTVGSDVTKQQKEKNRREAVSGDSIAGGVKQYKTDIAKLYTGNDAPDPAKILGTLTGSPAYQEQEFIDDDYIYSPIKWTENERFSFSPSGNSIAIEPAKNKVKDGNKNLALTVSDGDGIVTELYDFITTTVKEYPADQYALILWDHGCGPVAGYGSDEREFIDKGSEEVATTAIRGNNIRATLNKAKETLGDDWKDFAFAGYDACLMSDWDDISAWQDHSRFLIVSEDLEPSDGWYYIKPFYELTNAALTDGENKYGNTDSMDELTLNVGKTIVDEFVGWYGNNSNGTLALIDLRNKESIKAVNQAIDDLSGSFLDYLLTEPGQAYNIFFNGNREAINFGIAENGWGDLRSLCVKVKNLLPAAEGDRDEREKDLYQKADALQRLIYDTENNTGNPVVYYKDTGVYEGEKTMGGFTLYTPYKDTGSGFTVWKQYYKDTSTTPGYIDMMHAIAVIQDAGELLYEITFDDKKYPTEGAAYDAVLEKIESSCEKYGVSDLLSDELSYIAWDLCDGRIRSKDLSVVSRNGVAYSRNEHWLYTEDIYQHPRLEFRVSENKAMELPLGYFPERSVQGNNRLPRYKTDKWFTVATSAGKDEYPLNVLEVRPGVSSNDEELMAGDTEVTVAAALFNLEQVEGYLPSISHTGTYALVDVEFKKGRDIGEITGYRTYNPKRPNAASRYVPASDFDDKTCIAPVYGLAESTVTDGYSHTEPKTGDGLYILSATPIKSARISYKTIDDAILDPMAALLKDWETGDNETLGVSKGSFEPRDEVRDMFSNAYHLDTEYSEETEKKATFMLYGIGSDLERKSYSASFDITEIISGLTAARAKLGKDLPVNVIADIGGVSFDPDEDEKKDNITREDKLEDRQTAREGISSKDAVFSKYDQDMTRLSGKSPDITSYEIFDSIAPSVSENVFIDWEKNQRYELLPATKAGEGIRSVVSANNAYDDEDQKALVPMTQADDSKVVTELYDFVKSTMENYPADQYFLVFWDHGNGPVKGFGHDERQTISGGITSDMIKNTFDRLKTEVKDWNNLALAGYDACLMGNTDVAGVWKEYADYFVGSEDLESGNGWYYTPFIEQLCEEAGNDDAGAFAAGNSMEKITEKTGTVLVDEYVKWYKEKNDIGTLALLKLKNSGFYRFDEAKQRFSKAFVDYIKNRPAEAFTDLFLICDDAIKFGEQADLRSMACGVMDEYSADKDKDQYAKALYEAAEKLIAESDSKDVVIHSGNTGYYEQLSEGEASKMGQLSVFMPHRYPQSQESWTKYLELYRQLDPKTTNYRDMMGAIQAIKEAGTLLYDVTDGKYPQKTDAVKAIGDRLSATLQANGVSKDIADALNSAVPSILYEKRVTPDDTRIYVINDEAQYEGRKLGDGLMEGLGQHGYLELGNEGLGLGWLPGGNTLSDNHLTLKNYGTGNWIWMKSSNDQELIYPAAVYDAFSTKSDGDTMNGELQVTVPAVTVTGDGSSEPYQTAGYIYIDVTFDEGSRTGIIEGYSAIDTDVPYANGRVYEISELEKADVKILPLYNAAEKLYYRELVDFSYPVDGNGNVLKPVEPSGLIISRGEEEAGLDALDKANPQAEGIDISADYYLRDMFGSSYRLTKKENRTFGIRWASGDPDETMRYLAEGRVIRPQDFYAVVKSEGEYDRENTDKYSENILSNIWVGSGSKSSLLTASGYTLSAEDAASGLEFSLRDADLTPVKMEPGYDKMTEEEKAQARGDFWNNVSCVTDIIAPKASVITKAVPEDATHSGMDPVMDLRVDPDDGLIYMTMVKGQSYTLGKGTWESDNKNKVSVGKTNGKLSAKKVTEKSKTEGKEDEVVTVTNTATGQKYKITVESPALYEQYDDEGQSRYALAKTLTLTTGTLYGEGTLVLRLLSSEKNGDGVPESIALNPVFTSANNKVATVDSEGNVKAVAKGSAKITAWVNGRGYSCTVKVTDTYSSSTRYGIPKSFGLTKDEESGAFVDSVVINPGISKAMSYNKKSGFVPKKAVWKYYDNDDNELKETEASAIVDKNGKIVAKKEGEAVLKGEYSANGTTVSAEVYVTVDAAPQMKAAYLMKDKTVALNNCKVNAKNAVWESVYENVASVDKGKVKGLSFGTSDVTCSYNGASYVTSVYVESPELDTTDERITADSKSKNTYELKLKKNERFIIEGKDIHQKLLWKSNKNAVAFADENGVIYGRGAGSANVTTKLNGTAIKIKITVE